MCRAHHLPVDILACQICVLDLCRQVSSLGDGSLVVPLKAVVIERSSVVGIVQSKPRVWDEGDIAGASRLAVVVGKFEDLPPISIRGVEGISINTIKQDR